MSQTPPMTDSLPLPPNGRDATPELTSKREKRTRDPDEDDRDRSERRRRHHDDDDRDRDHRRRSHRDRDEGDDEVNGDRDRERERERERRHRRHRERDDHDAEGDGGEHRRSRYREDETEEEREERRRRRRERERERERDTDRGNGDDHRERRSSHNNNASKELLPDDLSEVPSRHRERRERSRESHRSHRSRDIRERDDRDGRDGRDGRDRRDDYDRDRERRDSRREITREEREAERERRDREMREERREAARQREERFAEMDRERARERRAYDRPPRSRSPYSPRQRRGSPIYNNSAPPPPPPREPPPPLDPATQVWNSIDSENRSIFISQIAARMTSSDLGLFFEDSLGPNSVKDARVVTDRQSQRSKGIAYVELTDPSYVNKALGLSGSIVMGIPIIVQLTEAERNREGKTIEQLVAQATKEMEAQRPRQQRERREQIHFPNLSTGLRLPPGFDPDQNPDASIPYHRLYLINVAYSLSENDLRAVFEPFGHIEFIDQHVDHHGNPKGTAYVQFRELRAAQMALDAMNGFELAGRSIKAMAINEKSGIEDDMDATGRGPRGYGGPKLDARGRMSLMQKLARTEDSAASSSPVSRPPPPPQQRADPTPFIVVSNMFNPEEETERNWDLDLAEDVKGEVESKYGKLKRIKVDKMSAGEVYMEFNDGARFADMAVQGLNGRFFGGRQLRAEFISEALFKAHL